MKAVKSLQRVNSKGLVEVIPEMFFLGFVFILPSKTRFFNRLSQTAEFSISWGRSIMAPLHKKGNLLRLIIILESPFLALLIKSTHRF